MKTNEATMIYPLSERNSRRSSKIAVSPLSRVEETELAQRIADTERELWKVILSNRLKIRFPVDRVRKFLYLKKTYKDRKEVVGSLNKICQLAGNEMIKEANILFDESLNNCLSLLTRVDIDRELISVASKEAIKRSTLKIANGHEKSLPHAKIVSWLSSEVEVLRHKFINANQVLVVSIAKRYGWAQMSLDDRIQEGNLGLIKAVNRFDYKKGYLFSTYASWWIQVAIGRAIDNNENMIRIPVSIKRNRSLYRNALFTLTKRNGRNPTDKEIREETGMGRLKLKNAQKLLTTQYLFLDQTVSGSNGLRFLDVLADERDVGPFEETMVATLAKEMLRHIESLSQLERGILAGRYGLNNCDVLSLKKLGDQYGYSRERIRQIQHDAIGKLRMKMSLNTR